MICMLGSRYARRDSPEGEDTHAYIGAGEREFEQNHHHL